MQVSIGDIRNLEGDVKEQFLSYSSYYVYGGQRSGKSQVAENLVTLLRLRALGGEESDPLQVPATYLATMFPGKDPENLARIRRHQENRKEAAYETVDLFAPGYLDRKALAKALPKGEAASSGLLPSPPVLLLDCLDNLLSNLVWPPVRFLAEAEGEEGPQSSQGDSARLSDQQNPASKTQEEGPGLADPESLAPLADPYAPALATIKDLLGSWHRHHPLVVVGSAAGASCDSFEEFGRSWLRAMGNLQAYMQGEEYLFLYVKAGQILFHLPDKEGAFPCV